MSFTKKTHSTNSVSFRPLDGYEKIGLCRDTCAPEIVLEVMTAWHKLANVLQEKGLEYPGTYFPISNQLLREQTNTNDGNTLRALPNLKTQSGRSYKSVEDALETHNTPVCRNFMHWLKRDILPQRVFPALESKDPNEAVDIIKAVMYYVLWHENKDRAKMLGEPPNILAKKSKATIDEIKEHARDFSHVDLFRQRRSNGNIALTHPLVAGIRASELWPWKDPHFRDETDSTKPELQEFHFNLADLSMMSMFMNGIAQNPGEVDEPRNHLMLFVSNDAGFMNELSEYAYGHRIVRQNVDHSEYRQYVRDYNELSSEIEKRQEAIRYNARKNQNSDAADSIAEIELLKTEREKLRNKYEEPIAEHGKALAKVKKNQIQPLLDEEYQRYSSRGLDIAQPPPYLERPDILILSPIRFLDMMKDHMKEIGHMVKKQKKELAEDADYLAAMAELRSKIFQLKAATKNGYEEALRPNRVYQTQRALREYVEKQIAAEQGERKGKSVSRQGFELG